MFIKKFPLLFLLFSTLLFSGIDKLSLQDALERLKRDNLELKISRFTEQMKQYDTKVAQGHNYGKLNASLTGMRSNDAGNVFGFKLQSREATFGDFGFAEFDMSGNTNPLPVEPKALNYPKSHTYYQTKLSYVVPLYTGGKLTEYEKITKAMQRMSQYDTQKLYNEKVFQTKKSFYDISLIDKYIQNLSKIITNITKLENTVESMKDVGYAKDIDLLEVQARKSEVVSMYNQANLNQDLAYQFLSFLLNEEVSSIKKTNSMAKLPSISISEIESNNIDIQKARLGLEMTGMALNVEKSNYLPQVGGFAEYSSADNSLWNEFSEKDSYTVGVQMNLNLFNGGIDSANLEKAKVNHLKVQDQVRLAKKGIALKVKKLHTEILNNDSDIKSFKKQLRFAKSVYLNYKERYREGLSSISDVLVKQSKELEVLLKLLTVQNTRNTKIFELNSLLNEGGM
ncbi:MAG: TolC family protein [Campylobacterota bacterium]|nr:TolC family protein [Campylobacterota bacterium]